MKSLPYIARVVTLAALYFIAGKPGFVIHPVETFAAMPLSPSGISLAALLLFGYKLWPGILLGAFLVNSFSGVPSIPAAEIAVGNALEALLGYYLLQRCLGFRPSLDRLRDALGLVVFAGILSSIVGATIGASSLWLHGLLPASGYPLALGTWWLGNMLGAVVVAPVLLTWSSWRNDYRAQIRGTGQWAEPAALAAAVTLFGVLALANPFSLQQKTLPLTYLVFPVLTWAALRFGPPGTTLATFTMSTIAIGAELSGFGESTRATQMDSLMSLQAFVAVAAATTLILAAVVSDRHLSERLASETARRLKILQDISLAVTSTLDLPSVLQTLLRETESLLPHGAVSFIRLRDKETGTLRTLATSTITEEELKQSILSGRIALRSVVGEKKNPEIVANVSVDRRIPHLELFQKYLLVSYLGLPLIVKGETLGDVSIFTREEHRFSHQEIEIFSTLADQAAIAIYNSQLFDETKRQADELRTANEERADFSAMIVHDLRAPLTSIMGASEILQQGSLGPLNPEQRQWLEKIEAASRRLLELVRNFLDLSKLEAGRLDVVKREMDLDRLVRETLDFYQPLARGKDIVLRKRMELRSPTINADPNRLEQVLANLLSNAIKFSRPGGAVELGADQEGNREVKLWVRDEGAGIPAREIGQLFEKYRQTTSGKNSKSDGTGLGLVICKMIVEAHGGRIWVDSEEAKGSTFYFSLPAEG